MKYPPKRDIIHNEQIRYDVVEGGSFIKSIIDYINNETEQTLQTDSA